MGYVISSKRKKNSTILADHLFQHLTKPPNILYIVLAWLFI